MNPLKFFLSVGGAIGIGLAITPAQATPVLTSVQGQPSTVTTVRSGPPQNGYRRHYPRHYGYRSYYPRHYGYRTHYRQYNNPDVYATGSNRWWQEMDRLQRGGRR
jgi:hypothetical protein